MEALESRRLLATFTVTNLNPSGPGSLPQAIINANANPATADTITFKSSLNGGTITTGSSMSVTGPVLINGQGRNITVNTPSSVPTFTINASGVTIQALKSTAGAGVKVIGGDTTLRSLNTTGLTRALEVAAGASVHDIGGLYASGSGVAFVNAGNLLASGTVIRDTATDGIQSSGDLTFDYGGFVWNNNVSSGEGNVVITDGTFSAFRATFNGSRTGSGVVVHGDASATIDLCYLNQNAVAGLSMTGTSTVTLGTRTEVSLNSAVGILQNGPGSVLAVNESSVSRNPSGIRVLSGDTYLTGSQVIGDQGMSYPGTSVPTGPGLSWTAADSNSQLHVVTTTIGNVATPVSGNVDGVQLSLTPGAVVEFDRSTISNHTGAGIDVVNGALGTAVTVVQCTIANNAIGVVNDQSTWTVGSSILWNSTDWVGSQTTIVDQGFNVISAAHQSSLPGFNAPTNTWYVGVSPITSGLRRATIGSYGLPIYVVGILSSAGLDTSGNPAYIGRVSQNGVFYSLAQHPSGSAVYFVAA